MSATTATASPSPTGGQGGGGGGGGGPTSSPLLFFVALGFGVVFTNLWYVCVVPPRALDQSDMLCFLGSSSVSSTASATTNATAQPAPLQMESPSTSRLCPGRTGGGEKRS